MTQRLESYLVRMKFSIFLSQGQSWCFRIRGVV